MIRNILRIAVLLVLSQLSDAVIARVASCTAAISGNSTTMNCTINPIGANHLLVWGAGGCFHTGDCRHTNGGEVWTPSDGFSLTWNSSVHQVAHCNSTNGAGTDDGEKCDQQIWCAVTGANAGSDTFTLSSANTFAFTTIAVLELSGTTNSCTPDGTGTGNAFIPTNIGSTTVATSSFVTGSGTATGSVVLLSTPNNWGMVATAFPCSGCAPASDVIVAVDEQHNSNSTPDIGAGFKNFDGSTTTQGSNVIEFLIATALTSTVQGWTQIY